MDCALKAATMNDIKDCDLTSFHTLVATILCVLIRP